MSVKHAKGIQCRSMVRPCRTLVCTRPECQEGKPFRVHAACGKAHSVYDTTCGTKNGSTGSESVPQSEDGREPLYVLSDLSARDIERLEQALRMLRRTFTRDSPMYAEVSALGHRVSGLK